MPFFLHQRRVHSFWGPFQQGSILSTPQSFLNPKTTSIFPLTASSMVNIKRLFIILLTLLVFQESDASVITFFQKLVNTDRSNTKLVQVSHSSLTSLAPGPAPQLNSRSVHEEICGTSGLYQCHDDINKVVACLPAAEDGSHGSTLFIRNDGESNLKLTVTLIPVNYAYNKVEISQHQVQKINLSSNFRESSSIRVDCENGGCVIQLKTLTPLGKLYKGYATPINSAYLLFGTVVLIGGLWACCKFRNKGRHLDGVPYKEIEMKHEKESLPYVETSDNWDQNWDDDWDEENAVRSPGGNRPRS